MNHALHATCVAWFGRGVLITGPSGSGKSTLALKLIERGWMLVADDAVIVENGIARGLPKSGGWLMQAGNAPQRLPYRVSVPLVLKVALYTPSFQNHPSAPAIIQLLAHAPNLADLVVHHLIVNATALP
jgi:HPr Serine kinase C-terminal domain